MLNQNAAAYAATTLAASAMDSVFFFYYVKLFLDQYKVSASWFQFAQVVYMFWNAINDPLFGYFQDNSNWSFCRRRKRAIYYGAPIWAITFLLPWFAWADYTKYPWVAGVHLIVTLCAYDSMLTFVLLAHCALFSEISQKKEDRMRLVKYTQVASLIGSTSVFWSSLVSDNMKNIFNLKIYCICVAVFAFFCLRYSGKNVTTQYEDADIYSDSKPLILKDSVNFSFRSALKTTKEILFNRNFVVFVIMNFFQVFHGTFCANFMLIFANHLIPAGVLPSFAMSAIYGVSFVLPQLIIFLGGTVIAKCGVYRVIMSTFFVQAVSATVLYLLGMNMYWALAFFMILDKTTSSMAFKLENIPISDIIDEDMKIHGRNTPQSSMVFGTNALITKPSNSLAPMMVVAILNNYGYGQLEDLSQSSELDASSEDSLKVLHSAMFSALCFIPLVVSLVQSVVWSFYSLKNGRTVAVKHTEA